MIPCVAAGTRTDSGGEMWQSGSGESATGQGGHMAQGFPIRRLQWEHLLRLDPFRGSSRLPDRAVPDHEDEREKHGQSTDRAADRIAPYRVRHPVHEGTAVRDTSSGQVGWPTIGVGHTQATRPGGSALVAVPFPRRPDRRRRTGAPPRGRWRYALRTRRVADGSPPPSRMRHLRHGRRHRTLGGFGGHPQHPGIRSDPSEGLHRHRSHP